MDGGEIAQWKKAIYTYFFGVLVLAGIFVLANFFEIADKNFSRKFGGIVAFVFIVGFAFRSPMSIGAYFYRKSRSLIPIGVVVSIASGMLGLLLAITAFQFFAFEFHRPLIELLVESYHIMLAFDMSWWRIFIIAMSSLLALLGAFGVAKGNI